MSVIKRVYSVAGIRHWAQYYTMLRPSVEVFVVVGHDTTSGLYWFRSLKQGSMVSRNFYQLNKNGFVPFCLDHRKIESFLETGKDPYAPF